MAMRPDPRAVPDIAQTPRADAGPSPERIVSLWLSLEK